MTKKKNKNVGKCPWCKDGYLIIRNGKYGKFVSCTNYPSCTYKMSVYDFDELYSSKPKGGYYCSSNYAYDEEIMDILDDSFFY